MEPKTNNNKAIFERKLFIFFSRLEQIKIEQFQPNCGLIRDDSEI